MLEDMAEAAPVTIGREILSARGMAPPLYAEVLVPAVPGMEGRGRARERGPANERGGAIFGPLVVLAPAPPADALRTAPAGAGDTVLLVDGGRVDEASALDERAVAVAGGALCGAGMAAAGRAGALIALAPLMAGVGRALAAATFVPPAAPPAAAAAAISASFLARSFACSACMLESADIASEGLARSQVTASADDGGEYRYRRGPNSPGLAEQCSPLENTRTRCESIAEWLLCSPPRLQQPSLTAPLRRLETNRQTRHRDQKEREEEEDREETCERCMQ